MIKNITWLAEENYFIFAFEIILLITIMKKVFLFSIVALLCINALCQWTFQTVDNGLDDPYRIAFSSKNNGGYLKIEPMPSVSPCYVIFYVTGIYFCDNNPTINISFLINGEYLKFLIVGEKSDDNKTMFFGSIEGNSNTNVNSTPGNTTPYAYGTVNFLPYFKAASLIKIRVNESHCEDDYYEFNMAGSTAAYNYVTNGCSEWKAKEKDRLIEKARLDSIKIEYEKKYELLSKVQKDSLKNAAINKNKMICDSIGVLVKFTPQQNIKDSIYGKKIGTTSDSAYVISYRLSKPLDCVESVEIITPDGKTRGFVHMFWCMEPKKVISHFGLNTTPCDL